MRRWLRADALKPWQYRSWVAPRAPDFAARAAVVLDPYAGSYDGEPLGEGDFVLCSDEKTSIQARCRCHPTLPPGRDCCIEPEGVTKTQQSGGSPSWKGAKKDSNRSVVPSICRV